MAVRELLAGAQHDFPVVEDGRVIGMLTRADLVRALSQHGRSWAVGEAMNREVTPVGKGESLEQAFPRLREKGVMSAPVLRGGTLVGVLTLENVSEFVMVRTALRSKAPPVIS